MKSRQIKKTVQLTIRDVPLEVKKVFWLRAEMGKKSLNDVLVEALSGAAGIASEPVAHTDLDELAGLWKNDAKFVEVIVAQDQVDPYLWK